MAAAAANSWGSPRSRPRVASTTPPTRRSRPRLVSILASSASAVAARGDRDGVEDVVDDLGSRQAAQLRLGCEHEPVLEDGTGHGLEVVGHHVLASEGEG